MGWYQYQLFVLCGFGWLADKWVLARWTYSNRTHANGNAYGSLWLQVGIQLTRYWKTYSWSLNQGNRIDLAIFVPGIRSINNSSSLYNLCWLRWVVCWGILLGSRLGYYWPPDCLQCDAISRQRLWYCRWRCPELDSNVWANCIPVCRDRRQSSSGWSAFPRVLARGFCTLLDVALDMVAFWTVNFFNSWVEDYTVWGLRLNLT